jgi:flavin-dependent dehydrogenase
VQPIHIIGGGLAGLALGIKLREENVSVRITEAGAYPRHRVCGEFISGRGADLLRRVADRELLADAHARLAHTAAFFLKNRCLGSRPLPHPALCVSRHALDALLARRFREQGGELQLHTRAGDGGGSDTPPEEGLVVATGRRRQPVDENLWRWFGIKAHFTGAAVIADLEMHVDTQSYIGICKLGNGVVNVCGLFRRRSGEINGVDPLGLLRGSRGTVLHDRLSGAQLEHGSLCTVAGLGLRRVAPPPAGQCRIGDAWTMIPPITGNGMSMALESAALASGPLESYARGERNWSDATSEVQDALRQAFAKRLRWASVLHRSLFLVSRWERLAGAVYALMWKPAFTLTR